MEALSSERSIFTLLPPPPCSRPATPPYSIRLQSSSPHHTNPCARLCRPIIVRKHCVSAQPSAVVRDLGGWADSNDCGGWENLDVTSVFHDFGTFNLLREYLSFINKDERKNITLFFLGFMCALAVSPFKSSLPAAFPVCLFLFVAAFFAGYVCGDLPEDVEGRNRKLSGSRGSADASSDKTSNLGSLLNELDGKLSGLENAVKGKKMSDFGAYIQSIKCVQLAIEESLRHDHRLVLAGRYLGEGYVEETYSSQKPSRRRSKQLSVGVDIMHLLRAVLQKNFLGSKSFKAIVFPAYGSQMHDGANTHESCKEKVDGHPITSELDKLAQGSAEKMNSIGSMNGSLVRAEMEEKNAPHIFEKRPEGGNDGANGWEQLTSVAQESLCASDMAQDMHPYLGGSVYGNGCSPLSQGPKALQPAENPGFEVSLLETHTLQECDSKDEPEKELKSFPENFTNNRICTKKLVDQQASRLTAFKNQRRRSKWPNFGQNSDREPNRFYDEAKETSQLANYDDSRFPEISNLHCYRRKAKKVNFDTQTEIAGFGCELNFGEDSLQTKDQSSMNNHGALDDSLLSLSMVEEEKKFKVSLDEGVLLLNVAKECLVSELDEEVVERILTKSAGLLSRATEIKPTSLLAVGLWGNTLLLHGKIKLKISREIRAVLSSNDSLFGEKKCREKMILDLSDVCEECEQLLVEAGRKYRMALSIDNNDVRALYNWGLALFFRAQLIADVGPDAAYDADKVYLAAIDKFDAMLARNSAHATSALFRWGMVLQQRSLLRPIRSKDRTKLLLQAKRLFEDVLSLDSSYIQAKEALSFCIDDLGHRSPL